MDILGKLFNSPARVKLMRLFAFNPGLILSRKEIASRSRISPTVLRRELRLLAEADFIRARALPSSKRGPGSGTTANRGWELNQRFPLLSSLKVLFTDDFIKRKSELVSRFKNCGRIKMLVLSGMFTGHDDSRVDICLVGDRMKRAAVDNIVKGIEADMGRELVYAVLETEDFLYRSGTGDKFIRDIFDYPYELIIDKLEWESLK